MKCVAIVTMYIPNHQHETNLASVCFKVCRQYTLKPLVSCKIKNNIITSAPLYLQEIDSLWSIISLL